MPKEFYKGKAIVAFTLCIKDRLPIFSDPEIVKVFTDILTEITKKYKCLIPAFCFMPDHQHIVITGTDDEVDLLKVASSYKQKTGFWMTKNKIGAKWQKDFYDHVLKKEESLTPAIRYILDNPVRKGIVSDWQEYAFKGAIGCDLEDILTGIV